MQLLHHSLASNNIAKLGVSRRLRQNHPSGLCSMLQPETSSSLHKTSSIHSSGVGPAVAVLESLQRQGLQGARIIHTQHEPIPAEAAAIKTMVLVRDDLGTAVQHVPGLQAAAAPAAAVAVLLLAGHKVDLRAVAQHMQLPKGSLRLATPDEAVHSTGYKLGCIPPLGHKHPLRTLVDVHIAQQPPQQLICAGGGQQDTQLLVSVQQLMTVTAGESGAFSTTKQPTVGLTQQSRPQQQPVAHQQKQQQQQQQQQQEQKQQQLGPSAYAHLPLPWADGSQEVELVGVLAQRRRIAKLLLFATLVPETVPALPSDGTAAYVRRLWRHPASGMPCEVQLIIGKTIERQLGRDGAAALFDKLKVGAVVALRGRPQHHPQTSGAALGSNRSHGSDVQHDHVLDVVVQEVRVLHKNRDTLARAISAAWRRGHSSVASALDLEQLTAGQASADTGTDADAGKSATQQQPSRAHVLTRRAAFPAMRQPTAAAAPGRNPAVAKASSAAAAQAICQETQVQQQDSASADYYPFPLGLQLVSLVQDLEGVVRMHQAVLQDALQHSSSRGSPSSSHFLSDISSSSISGSASWPVVGIDCEWQPYERGSPKTPVALLQLATRDQVFLVDMLAICRQQDQHGQQQGADGDNACGNNAPSSHNSSSQVCWDGSAVSAAEALAYFLQQLFVHQGLKVIGFGLKGDLQRLANSYPWLLSTAAASAGSSCGSKSSSDNDDGAHQPADSTSQHTTSSTALPDSACELIISNEAASSSANESDVDDDQAGGVWVVQQAVDMQQLCNKPTKSGSRHIHGNAGSLSTLVRKVLGKPLDKSQQASSWGSRPLTDEQLVYAANDAHVLTVLYDKLVGTGGDGCNTS